jgi:hypothetical protein
MLRSALTTIIELRGADIGMSQPGLDFDDIGFMLQGSGGCGCLSPCTSSHRPKSEPSSPKLSPPYKCR